MATNQRKKHQILYDIESQSKECTVCGLRKDFSQFYKHKLTGDGRCPDCKDCVKERTKRWGDSNKHSHRMAAWRYHLIRKYSITLDDFDRMLQDQSGLCAICGVPMRDPQVDHCHASGEVRMLLCRPFNIGVGYFKDDESILRRAADYVESFK